MTGPLSGIRVLDLTRVLAGPLCTMILGDLGADVIKIERPEQGDDSRGWGPPFDERGESAYFLSCNRNKLSVAADLTRDVDVAMLRSLVAECDVVVDNFLPGTLERRGLNPSTLLEEHPRLIWCTITGFGPESSRPGYDFVVQAESGWMAITGEPDGGPMKAGVALVDVITGKDAAIQLLAALASRSGGRSAPASERRRYVSLRDTAVGALVNVAQNALVTGRDAKRWGNAHANLVPYQLFQAADRPVVIAVGNDSQFAALVATLELPELAHDTFRTNAGRVEHRSTVTGAIAGRLASRLAAEWISALDSAGVPCGVVRSVLEALGEVTASPIFGVAAGGESSVRLLPPRLNEHGELVRAHGFGAFERLARLGADGQGS